MARAQYPGPAEALAHYEDAVAACEDIERKGAKNPYTSRNGHMFSHEWIGTLPPKPTQRS